MRKFILLLLLPALLQGQNNPIKIFEGENAYHGPCEPSIVINPKNPANVVAGSVLNYFHYSLDSGKTWHTDKLNSSYGVWATLAWWPMLRDVFITST